MKVALIHPHFDAPRGAEKIVFVQAHAMRAWKEDRIFHDEVAADPAITKLLSPKTLARTFDSSRQLVNVDAIFKRVLGAD